jgi:hypothetical protein
MQPRLSLTQLTILLPLPPNAGVTGMNHHPQLSFLNDKNLGSFASYH